MKRLCGELVMLVKAKVLAGLTMVVVLVAATVPVRGNEASFHKARESYDRAIARYNFCHAQHSAARSRASRGLGVPNLP